MADHILVIRLGAVGDVVRTLPAVSALRAAWPGSRLSWLVEPASADIVRGQPWVDEVLVFPRQSLGQALVRGRWLRLTRGISTFSRELRSRKFDLVVDFHSILKSGLLSWASGAPVRVAYGPPFGRELSWLFATERARLAPRRMSRFERNDSLVRFLGVTTPASATPLQLDRGSRARADALFDEGRRPVALHPGTSDATPHKRYPTAGYAAVAQGLRTGEGVSCIVTWGPARGEREAAQAIVAASRGAAELAPETRSLTDLAALLARCRLYVGGDTGPLHLASLVGTPVVQILGPTDPVENAPYAETPSRTVRVPVACSPCRRGCAAATCMRVVPPEAVLTAARELLAEPSVQVPRATT